MKRSVLLLLMLGAFLVNNAHDLQNGEFKGRIWTLKQSQSEVFGSFHHARNKQAWIQLENHSLVLVPISELKDEDQEYVQKRLASIDALNSKLKALQKEESSLNLFTDGTQWGLFAFMGLLLALLVVTVKKQKYYLAPLLWLGVLLITVGFTQETKRLLKFSNSIAGMDSAFAPFTSQVHTYVGPNYYYVESKGIPATHNMMVGISSKGWQRQVPIPQCYLGTNAWPIPLNPVLAANPIPVDSIHFTRGAIAVAVNGIPIFNVHTNTGVDSYLDGQLDEYGGHCGRADDYHYHTAPLHLYAHTSNKLPIAYGLDGFPVFGNQEPDGTSLQSLDANHGHMYQGNYHYHGSNSAPYMIARMAGEVTEDGTHQLIPQAAAKPVRPSLTPLSGALITACTPNATKTGYNLSYSYKGSTDSVVYNWTTNGQYTFKYYSSGNLDSTRNFNGFVQCQLPITGITEAFGKKNQILIYPNPAQDWIQLKGMESLELEAVYLYNLDGQLIRSYLKPATMLDIQGISKGIYLLLIQNGKQLSSHKVFVGN